MRAASWRPCSRPASAAGTRHAGSSEFGTNASSDAASAKTPSTRRCPVPNAAISAASPSPKGEGWSRPAGNKGDHVVAVSGEGDVDGAADTAVHEAPTPDGHRRPGPGHRAARGNGVDQWNPRRGVQRDELTGGDVDRGEPQIPRGPVLDGSQQYVGRRRAGSGIADDVLLGGVRRTLFSQIVGEMRVPATPLVRDGGDGAAAERRVCEFYGVETLDGFGAFTRAEIAAAALALAYVKRTQFEARPALSPRPGARAGRASRSIRRPAPTSSSREP